MNKQIIKMQYDDETELLHIVDTVPDKPDIDDGYIYATIEDVLKIKSTMIKLDTRNVPQILLTFLDRKYGY